MGETFMNDFPGRNFEPVESVDELASGGWVRYAIELPDGDVLQRKGGILVFVDGQRRFLKLKNPFTHAQWSVQLVRAPGETLHLWYRQPRSSIDPWRTLLDDLESGKVVVRKLGHPDDLRD